MLKFSFILVCKIKKEKNRMINESKNVRKKWEKISVVSREGVKKV